MQSCPECTIVVLFYHTGTDDKWIHSLQVFSQYCSQGVDVLWLSNQSNSHRTADYCADRFRRKCLFDGSRHGTDARSWHAGIAMDLGSATKLGVRGDEKSQGGGVVTWKCAKVRIAAVAKSFEAAGADAILAAWFEVQRHCWLEPVVSCCKAVQVW